MDRRPKVNIYPSRDDLSAALAEYVAKLAAIAHAEQRRFHIALSGGSLMDILSPALCSAPLRHSIDWSSWHVFWVDERWVPWSSPESNYRLTEEHLFSRVPIPREHIYGMDTSLDPAATARTYAAVMAEVLQTSEGGIPRFDLILLGIGEDGHTASLFPEHPVLDENKAWVAAVSDAPKPPPIRMTMTLPLINNGRNVVLVAAGPDKADIVSKVLNPQMQKHKHTLPAQLVNPADGELLWFIDRAAAAKSGTADVTSLEQTN